MSTFNQVSLLQALMLGGMEGFFPVEEAKKLGDFGIGTFDGSEGECILLDGILYKARVDGTVIEAGTQEKMPFGMFTKFEKSGETGVPAIASLEALSEELNKVVKEKGKNYIYAIKLTTEFSYMSVRSLGKQARPFPHLADALKDQRVYNYDNIKGTLIGYYCPDYLAGLNMHGWHYHFVSEDRKFGGHVLELKTGTEARVDYDVIDGFSVKIPSYPEFHEMDLAQDLKKDIEKAEK